MGTVVAHRTVALVGVLPEHPQLPYPHPAVVAYLTEAFVGVLPEHPQLSYLHPVVVAMTAPGLLKETKRESFRLLLGPLCLSGGILVR